MAHGGTGVNTERGSLTGRATALAVTSGKGGVGKTSLATNLGIALAREGARTCLLDADIGLANVNILLGLRPAQTLEDVISGEAALDDVLLDGPEGLRIVPAASGLERLGRRVDATARRRIVDQLAALERCFDYLLLDTPAGIGTGTMSFLQACDAVLLTITTEPTSLTDAFTLLKTLQRRRYPGDVAVMVNMVPAEQEGERLFRRFNAACERHLGVDLGYLGHVGMDRAVTAAVLRQQPLLLSSPLAPAARQIATLAGALRERFPPARGAGGFATFWSEWAGELGPATASGEPPPSMVEGVRHETAASADSPGDAERSEAQPAVPGSGDGDRSEATDPAASPVITPQRELREAQTPPPDVQALTDAIERALADPELAESDARRLFATAERAFGARFRRRATDLKNLIYGALLHEQLPREHHREMLATLRASYRQRYGAVPDDDERGIEALAEGVADLGDETLAELLERLTDTLAARPAVARRVLLRWLSALPGNREWRAGDAAALLRALDDAHRGRGDAPLMPDTTAVRDDLAKLRDELERRRLALERGFTQVCVLLDEYGDIERRLTELARPGDEPPAD